MWQQWLRQEDTFFLAEDGETVWEETDGTREERVVREEWALWPRRLP